MFVPCLAFSGHIEILFFFVFGNLDYFAILFGGFWAILFLLDHYWLTFPVFMVMLTFLLTFFGSFLEFVGHL